MLGASDHSRYRAGVGQLQFMIGEVPEKACAVKNLSRQLAKSSELDMQYLKQCVRYTLGDSDEWFFLTVQDKSRKTDEVAKIEVYTDADWAGDARSMKPTSSVFTRIDGFIIRMNAQLQDTRAEQRRKRVLRARSRMRRLTVRESDPERSRHANQDQSTIRRHGNKSIGAETRFVQENTARESEVLIRARPSLGQEKSKCREY